MPDSKNIFEQLKKRKVFRSIVIYAAFGYTSEALNILKELISGQSHFNWRKIKYDTHVNKFLSDNVELNKLISDDEKKYKSKAKY